MQVSPRELASANWICGLARWLSGKEFTCQCRGCRFDPWVWRSPAGGNGNPLQYSFLGNSMDRGAWWATVHVIKKSCSWLTAKQQKLNTQKTVLGCSKRVPTWAFWGQDFLQFLISHSLLQGIFPTQGSSPHLLHCRQILYCLSHLSK